MGGVCFVNEAYEFLLELSIIEYIARRNLNCLSVLPMKNIKCASCLIIWSLMMVAIGRAEIMTIELNNGRSEMVDVLGVSGDSVKVKWLKDDRVLSFPLSKLSAESKKEVLAKIKKSTSSYPPVEAEVDIGKRRKSSSSSYSKSMSITAKVTVTNEDRRVECPPCKCNMIFIGQSVLDKDQYVVLSNQPFTITPTDKGAVFESEPFVTTYSEYSGYKYVGSLIVVSDKKKHILFSKTLYPALKKAIGKNAQLVAKMTKYKTSTYLNKSMSKMEMPSYDDTRF